MDPLPGRIRRQSARKFGVTAASGGDLGPTAPYTRALTRANPARSSGDGPPLASMTPIRCPAASESSLRTSGRTRSSCSSAEPRGSSPTAAWMSSARPPTGLRAATERARRPPGSRRPDARGQAVIGWRAVPRCSPGPGPTCARRPPIGRGAQRGQNVDQHLEGPVALRLAEHPADGLVVHLRSDPQCGQLFASVG